SSTRSPRASFAANDPATSRATAMTAFFRTDSSPGRAVPGTWPGPLASVASSTPSRTAISKPIRGTAILATVSPSHILPRGGDRRGRRRRRWRRPVFVRGRSASSLCRGCNGRNADLLPVDHLTADVLRDDHDFVGSGRHVVDEDDVGFGTFHGLPQIVVEEDVERRLREVGLPELGPLSLAEVARVVGDPDAHLHAGDGRAFRGF